MDIDRQLADALQHTAQWATTGQTRSPKPGYHFEDNHADQRIAINKARNVRIKQFHIGKFQFGMGGLVSGIIGLIALLGGGTAAVVAASTTTPVDLASAVGHWERPGGNLGQGFEMGPAVLTVSANGQFDFSVNLTMAAPGNTMTPPPIPPMNIKCSGSLSPNQDHYTLRTMSGPCGTFDATLSPDGHMIDLHLQNGSSGGSLSLTKTKG